MQLPIDEENDFFEVPDNIRDQLKETHTELQKKFIEYAEYDLQDEIRMQK